MTHFRPYLLSLVLVKISTKKVKIERNEQQRTSEVGAPRAGNLGRGAVTPMGYRGEAPEFFDF